MFNLYDVSMTMDFGEVSDETEAVMVLHENDHKSGIMCGYVDGEYVEKRIEAPTI